MGRLKGTLILTLVAGGLGYAAYRVLLDENARESLASAAKTMGQAYDSIRTRVEELKGIEVEDDQPLANRQAAEQAWARLGY